MTHMANRRGHLAALTWAAVIWTVGLAEAAVPVLPKPEAYVTDRAGVMSVERSAALNEELAAFERGTSNQVVVYVDRRMPEGTTRPPGATRFASSAAIGIKITASMFAITSGTVSSNASALPCRTSIRSLNPSRRTLSFAAFTDSRSMSLAPAPEKAK